MLCSDLPHTPTHTQTQLLQIPPPRMTPSLHAGLHSETISVNSLRHPGKSRFTRLCAFLPSPTLTRSLPLFIALQVIKRQAAPRWQEGGEDWREGQRRVTPSHHYAPTFLQQTGTVTGGEGLACLQRQW